MIIAQATAGIMKEHGLGGSMVLIASMSGSIANRVSRSLCGCPRIVLVTHLSVADREASILPHLLGHVLNRLQPRKVSRPLDVSLAGSRMGCIRH